jgi:hypothetical protein
MCGLIFMLKILTLSCIYLTAKDRWMLFNKKIVCNLNIVKKITAHSDDIIDLHAIRS